MFPSLYDQIARKCRHFNGLSSGTCTAGVAYDSVKVPKESGRGLYLPCFKDEASHCACEHQAFPSHEEVEAEVAESDSRFRRSMLARKAIVEHLGGPWKKGMAGVGGRIDCPVCKQALALQFSRSGYNGHIHARCDTENCVAWME